VLKGSIRVKCPVVMGHEYSGVVAEAGKNVKEIRIGDYVTSESIIETCNKCFSCLSGHYSLCANRIAMGYRVDGAFSEYVVVPEEKVFKIPKTISPDQATFLEPLSCCVHGIIENDLLDKGYTVLILGPGTIGLLSLQIVNLLGCKTIVIGIEKDINRLKIAKRLGAAYAVNIDDPKENELIKEIIKKVEIDIAINCSGSEGAIDRSVKTLKNRGSLLQLGIFKDSIDVDFNKFLFKEITIFNSLSHIETSWRESIKMISKGQINVDILISDAFRLREWKKAFKVAEKGWGVKTIFHINKG
jgi:L-iditol 2-dehydrogenase